MASGKDPYRLGYGRPDRQPRTEHGELDETSQRIVVGYGFWIFLLSDIVMFAAFFAAWAVLNGELDGGPSGRQLFSIGRVAIETTCLLLSSYACGLAGVAVRRRDVPRFYAFMAATLVLGAVFLLLELLEFREMVSQGAGPGRSAFLSSFFALVGCHGLHVTAGLVWLAIMVAQVAAKGFQPHILRRLLCFSLFWHALDIVWVAIFSNIYLIGAGL